MSSFFDFANAARDKSRLTTNPFAKQMDFAPQTSGIPIPAADPNPAPEPAENPPFAQFAIQPAKKVTFAPLEVHPAQTTADVTDLITEENIEQEIKKLYEGFQVLQNWAASETAVLENLKNELSAVEAEVSTFVTAARESLKPS
jgi:hypothetical protein